MPDEAKLAALRSHGFTVRRTCGTCAYFNTRETPGHVRDPIVWGTCRLIRYAHEKHTGAIREASVRMDGFCASHAETGRSAEDLRQSGFQEFRVT